MNAQRLIVVSNRLPIVLDLDTAGTWHIESGTGGLVTALGPVLRDRGGIWIGWLGTPGSRLPDKEDFERLLETGTRDTGFGLRYVNLTPEEVAGYYAGFSNNIIWPLFHEFTSLCDFDPEYWQAYKTVNANFARRVAEESGPSDYIWVQDYHLLLMASQLKEMECNRTTGFFLHIPFPPLDIFLKVPWRLQILEAMLEFDLIGFQTVRDMRNFKHCVQNMIPDAAESGNGGQVRTFRRPDREVRVGAFPISIDFQSFADMAAKQKQSDQSVQGRREEDETLNILGVDRLDYTKGIPQRLRAIGLLLEKHPELCRKIVFNQVLVPSRQDVDTYDQLKLEIEQLVGEINGLYSCEGWVPVHYQFRSLSREELVQTYRKADVCLVTPLKDGMNLVAKEYCACSVDNTGALVLSEFAGTAAELSQGALLVNPYDRNGVAEALHQALTMPLEEQTSRMQCMRAIIRRSDIANWANTFLHAAITRDLSHFPRVHLFVPDSEPSEE
jgi:trehalose 6-phosphate synthase